MTDQPQSDTSSGADVCDPAGSTDDQLTKVLPSIVDESAGAEPEDAEPELADAQPEDPGPEDADPQSEDAEPTDTEPDETAPDAESEAIAAVEEAPKRVSPSARQRATSVRHQKAFRILAVLLIPLAVWTIAGLIALWPQDARSQLNTEVIGGGGNVTYAQATITAIADTSCEGMPGSSPGVTNQRCATISIRVLDGPDAGQEFPGIQLSQALNAAGAAVDQQVTVVRVATTDGQPPQYQFADYPRGKPMLWLTLAVAAAAIAIARWRGLAASVALGFAGLILVSFTFPALLSGTNAILVGLLTGSAIIFIASFAAYGLSVRTATAVVGAQLGLGLCTTLAWAAVKLTRLTGIAAEDNYLLAAAAPNLSLTAALICGIVVAGVGVLIQVSGSQAGAVWQLADSETPPRKLFWPTLKQGREQLLSAVYVLTFGVLGVSLPALLMLRVYDRPLFQLLSTEAFAGGLILILTCALGLLLTAPLTTGIGIAVARTAWLTRLASIRPPKLERAKSQVPRTSVIGTGSDAPPDADEPVAGADGDDGNLDTEDADEEIFNTSDPESPEGEGPNDEGPGGEGADNQRLDSENHPAEDAAASDETVVIPAAANQSADALDTPAATDTEEPSDIQGSGDDDESTTESADPDQPAEADPSEPELKPDAGAATAEELSTPAASSRRPKITRLLRRRKNDDDFNFDHLRDQD